MFLCCLFFVFLIVFGVFFGVSVQVLLVYGQVFGKLVQVVQVSCSIEVVFGDMYFKLWVIEVKVGEMVCFVLKNEGKLLYEFNLGDVVMYVEYQKEMLEMQQFGMFILIGMVLMDYSQMGYGMVGMDYGWMMKYDDFNSVLVELGKSVELIWIFVKVIWLEFVCNIFGYYQVGMVG